VNEVTVDGGRAATLVGSVRAWEYMLVWSPHGVVVRASLNCGTQESNVVLAANRFAHLSWDQGNYVVTGTIKPLRARISLRAAGSATVSLAGETTVVAGSVSLLGRHVSSVIWRFDAGAKKKLRTYSSRAVLVTVDRGRLLIDRPTALDVLTQNGALITTLRLAHEGGAAMHAGRVATISGRRLVVSRVDRKSLLRRSVAAGLI
jgi:large exoprotein involved in heme utilization and adhesion